MTDTTTYPLSAALSAALHSDSHTMPDLIDAVLKALIDEGAVREADYEDARSTATAGWMLGSGFGACGGLDRQGRRQAANLAVEALRNAGLLLDQTA